MKLCTGVSSVVRLRAALASASSERWAAATGWRVWRPRRVVVVDEQDWGQGLFHVPADVVGQHAQEHVGADPVGQPMPDGAHVQFGVEGAEEPFDVFESLVAQHHIVAFEGVFGQAGAQHVDAVEGGFGGDRVVVAGEVKESSVISMVKVWPSCSG